MEQCGGMMKKLKTVCLTVLLSVFLICIRTDKLQAEVIVDNSYSIAVAGSNIDLDGTSNVIVYLQYTEGGAVNTSKVDLTLQLGGSTSGLLTPDAYEWKVTYAETVVENMFQEIPLTTPNYTHSFNIAAYRDDSNNLIPSVKSASVSVYYDGTMLATKTFYIVTPITMNGFEAGYPKIGSNFIMLKRPDDPTERTTDSGRAITDSVVFDISSTVGVEWYYRPMTSKDDNDWKVITSKSDFIKIIESGSKDKVTFAATNQSGAITFVGRKRENGYYTQTPEFDVLIAAYSGNAYGGDTLGAAPQNEGVLKDLNYGDTKNYNDVVRYTGDMNVWRDGMGTTNSVEVVKFAQSDDSKDRFRELTANNYGETTLEFCPVTSTDAKYGVLYGILKHSVKANTVFDIIKASGGQKYAIIGNVEVLSVKSILNISTNLFPTSDYKLDWFANNTEMEIYNDIIKGEGTSTAFSYYSGWKLTAKRGGELKISCLLKELSGTKLAEKEFTVIVTDSLEIEPSSLEISVGDARNIQVFSTSNNTIYWDITDEAGNHLNSACISFVADPSGRDYARVTGLRAGIAYVTATQASGNSTNTVRCKVTVAESLGDVNIIYGEISEDKITLPEGESIDIDVEIWDSKGNPYNVKADDIKWVSLNENVATVVMDQYNPKKAKITANGVGKAYIAVVANDISQTQLDIVEVIVIAAPTGILLSEHTVEDSIDNETYRLIATIQPVGAQELEIEWTSSDESIATVNNNGIVTYKKPGEVVITARVEKYTDSCIFRIVTPARGITLSESQKEMSIGETVLLVATVLPTNATDKSIVWESSDTRVATVEESGLVTAVGSGTAYITCHALNSDVSATCAITVYQQVTSISLNYKQLTVRKGTILWLYARVIPETAVNKELVWSSSNTAVATVDENGQITALASGVTEIVVTNPDTGASDKCTLTVSESVTGITLNVRNMTLEIGQKFVIIPTVRPVEAENKEVTYMSSDPNVATVDNNGVVTGVKGGTAVIVCQTVDRGLIASCTVTVNEYITDIKFVDDEIYIPKGEAKTLRLKITPETANNRNFEWQSQNNSILTVDSSGVAYGLDYGTVIVTVSTTDGSELKATCKVHVIKSADVVTLSDSMIEIKEGKTYQLTATVRPDDTSIKKITWSSSDTSVARVNSFGVVTAIKEGVCTITAAAADGSGAFDRCEVTVKKSVIVTNLTVNPQDFTMLVGETRIIDVRMRPTDTTETYSWISSDDAVVKIDETNKVTAVGPGTAVVTAVTDTSGTEASFKVTVVTLNTTKLTLEQYDTYDLFVDGINNGITWYSRNKRVATVNARGQVVGRQAGTTTIVARINGKRVVCEITVTSLK